MGNDIVAWRSAIGLFGSRAVIFCVRSTFKVRLGIFSALFDLIKCLMRNVRYYHNLYNVYLNLVNIAFLLYMHILLMLHNDIESNPGPVFGQSYSLSILHCNIRSIRNKLDFVKENFADFDILCFSETHLDVQIPNDVLLLDGFDRPLRKDRTNNGGGLLVYLSKQLLSSRCCELENFCKESIWFKIRHKSKDILIGLFYSPKTADVDFFNSFNRNIENALEITDNIVLLGDLNEDLLNPNFHNLKNIMLINSLKNIVKEPTRINALLDPILINHDMTYLHSGALALPQYISDHKATFVCLPFSYDTGCSYKRIIWLYNKADFNSLNHMIGSHDWSFLECKTLTLDEACLQFTKIFNDFVKKCIPNKTVLIKPNDKPWFDGTIKRYIRIRDRLKKIAIKSNTTNVWAKYKTMRNKVNNSKKHA